MGYKGIMGQQRAIARVDNLAVAASVCRAERGGCLGGAARGLDLMTYVHAMLQFHAMAYDDGKESSWLIQNRMLMPQFIIKACSCLLPGMA